MSGDFPLLSITVTLEVDSFVTTERVVTISREGNIFRLPKESVRYFPDSETIKLSRKLAREKGLI